MIKKLLFFSASLLVLTTFTKAQNNGYGAGIMLGEPTGLSGKYWVNDVNALNAGIGWSFLGPNDGFSLHIDYLYHIDNAIQSEFRFPIYYGFGGRIRDENSEFGLGFRGVAGILWYGTNYPFDVFFELAPVFKLLPKTALELDIAIGARYYFE